MTLVQKVNKELEKVNLKFKQTKELKEKFKGILIDEKNNIQISYEIPKILQWDKVKSFASGCRSHIDMYVQLNEMKKGGK